MVPLSWFASASRTPAGRNARRRRERKVFGRRDDSGPQCGDGRLGNYSIRRGADHRPPADRAPGPRGGGDAGSPRCSGP